MLRNRLYYHAKPLLPRPVRMTLRRLLAQRQRASHRNTWPIDPRTAQAPPGWQGWPGGRRFAIVLTHDVEGPAGLARVLRLAALELELGFRSSFNFIPEGSYRVPPALRFWLTDHGFEVGVHDLHHDGHLLKSRTAFTRHAARINQHLHDWEAVGFRAGFMLHNLDWFHDLAIAYDLSTFDTDPFEPQPDAAGTLFPFQVHAELPAGRHSYVELPYTLPQDSTLFLVLREKSPAIWQRKLDWIAGHGGMALINVHPDYIRFSGDAASPDNFPADHYRAFLQHLRVHHRGAYWNALPRDVARFVTEPSIRPTAGAPGSAPANGLSP